MSDIVERLRGFAENCLKLEAAGGNEGAWLQIASTQRDAAAEIERLRDLLRNARDDVAECADRETKPHRIEAYKVQLAEIDEALGD